jgi:RNA polymerase sigma factor (sigma-70 family)
MRFRSRTTGHDRAAALYASGGDAVLRRAKRILGNESEAEEVLQELFLKLAEDPAQLDRAENAMAWLYGATTHACLNRIRNRKNRMRLIEQHRSADQRHELDPEARWMLDRTIAALPEDQAAALLYYHMDQMSHAEIAEVLGCSRRHVGNLLARAAGRLAELRGAEVTP